MQKELLTALEVAEKVKVTKQTINNWVGLGCPVETRLPIRFVWDDVKKWLNNRKDK